MEILTFDKIYVIFLFYKASYMLYIAINSFIRGMLFLFFIEKCVFVLITAQ